MGFGRESKNGIDRIRTSSRTRYKGGGYIAQVGYDMKAKEDAKKKKEIDKDSLERMNIHKDIDRLIEEGKDKSEIVRFLLEKYPASSVISFFDSYVDHHFEKNKSKNTKKDDKERDE